MSAPKCIDSHFQRGTTFVTALFLPFPNGVNSFRKELNLIEKGAKMKIAELLPWQAYAFTSKFLFLELLCISVSFNGEWSPI